MSLHFHVKYGISEVAKFCHVFNTAAPFASKINELKAGAVCCVVIINVCSVCFLLQHIVVDGVIYTGDKAAATVSRTTCSNCLVTSIVIYTGDKAAAAVSLNNI